MVSLETVYIVIAAALFMLALDLYWHSRWGINRLLVPAAISPTTIDGIILLLQSVRMILIATLLAYGLTLDVAWWQIAMLVAAGSVAAEIRIAISQGINGYLQMYSHILLTMCSIMLATYLLATWPW